MRARKGMPVGAFRVTVRAPSQPLEQSLRPGPYHLCTGHFRAPCLYGERREEHLEVRIRVSQVPFQSAQEPPVRARVHDDVREQAADLGGLPRPLGIR